VAVPPAADDIIERYLALPDMSCAVADATEALGVTTSVSGLRPVRARSRVCGPAVTLRYTPAGSEDAVLGDRDLYSLAPPGAVAVIDTGGHCDHAVVGEISAVWAELAGVAGVLTDGAVRDLDALSGAAIPIWSRGRSPQNARGRLDTAEINGAVRLADALVEPGDLVVADDNGAAVVPAAVIVEVLERCEQAQTAEAGVLDMLRGSDSLPDVIRRVRAGSTRSDNF
jgi:4-hydroxy-4-methyl-2-oxoglutarate aldolase